MTVLSVDPIMSHSTLASPMQILAQANSPPLYTPPPPTRLSHEQKLQWCETAKELMDATINKWTYPAIPLTNIENIQDLGKIAA